MAHIYAESSEFVQRNIEKLLKQGVTGPEGYALAHTEEAEEEACMRTCMLANQINCPLYLAHVSCLATLDIIRTCRNKKGHVVFGEITPAALSRNGQDYWNQDWMKAAAIVTCPPIRQDPIG